ncbi:hypothetical protein DFH09DRAFT_866618, partial [Mycena vulgaris]
MTDRLENFRGGYAQIAERVRIALRVQLGDAQRLGAHRDEVLTFLSAANQHRAIFPPGEFAILHASVGIMVEELEKACTESSDPCDARIVVVERRIAAQGAGRPRIEIDPTFLSQALTLREATALAPALGCSARTIRRRAATGLESAGGSCLHVEEVEPPGVSAGVEAHGTRMFGILQLFPNFGRSMIAGQLASQGINLAGAASDVVRTGLIRWKLVNHGFIDGKSRFVTAMRVHNNNRSATVLTLFLGGVAKHGWPSRRTLWWPRRWSCRKARGAAPTSMAKRLWLDWTQGVGLKWYDFLMSLEHNYGLD